LTYLYNNGTPHASLSATFDVRIYADGKARVDITVDNSRDAVQADQISYSTLVLINNEVVYSHPSTGFVHYYGARWRRVFYTNGLSETVVTPDFSTWLAAKATPVYWSQISHLKYPAPDKSNGAAFDMMRAGHIVLPLSAPVGAQPYIGLYPDWIGVYETYRDAASRAYILAHGDISGSFGIHFVQNDGKSLVLLSEKQNYWFDNRAAVGDKPLNNLVGVPPYNGALPSQEHMPSLAYFPYLLTGDRYYLDEMMFWANWGVVATWPGHPKYPRRGPSGLVWSVGHRGQAWVLRNVIDFAAYAPDEHEYKGYFTRIVNDNLVNYDSYAVTDNTPLELVIDDLTHHGNYLQNPLSWQYVYLAWVLDRAIDQGFTSTGALRDRLLRVNNSLVLSHPGWEPNRAGCIAWWITADISAWPTIARYTTWQQVRDHTASSGSDWPASTAWSGLYWWELRIGALLAMRYGLANSSAAYNYVMAYDDGVPGSQLESLRLNPRWALVIPGAPNPPQNLRTR
jgi:hypothetical protein